MRIEIKELEGREFYQEIINVLMQYKKFKKNPEAPLTDNFQMFRTVVKVAAVAFAVVLIVGFIVGWSSPILLCTAVCWVCAAMLLVNLRKMDKAVTDLVEDKRPSVVILDERGAALSKDGSLQIRMPWDHIEFVRLFDKSICFVPDEEIGIVIPLNKKYLDDVKEYLSNNDTGVKAIL